MLGVVAEGAGNPSVENRAVAEFLIAAGAQPSVLVIDGEAGIGKTTLCWPRSSRRGSAGFGCCQRRRDRPSTSAANSLWASVVSVDRHIVVHRMVSRFQSRADRL
jgi:hypothetical protein